MKINFIQVYAEIDTSYDITNTVLIPLKKYLNGLNKSVVHYDKLFKTDDYRIVFYISATREHKDFVKGPKTYSKQKKVEFFIFLPYKEFDIFTQQMNYILDCIGQGIIFVFKKYKTDPTGVEEVMDKMKTLITSDPEKYQKWTKRE
ncbi:hypothetical protein [Snodgrassella communis]|uniref:hypothetical protein n=1 Tax=Snodgrassella communis TaxID=2946699 RepID=UPI00286AF487|nr:hypothetical protein [Snodgrassella communis]WMY92608.1 hypothetical protein PYG29_04425 [Snodgrassella communis]